MGRSKKDLMKSIENYKTEFDNLDQSININERLAKLCPIHPMTRNACYRGRTLWCFPENIVSVYER